MNIKEKNRLDIQQDQIDRILYLLEGDPKFDQEGLAKQVHSVDDKLDRLLEREKIYKSKATTWGIIGGALVSAMIWVGKMVVMKFV